MLAPGTNNGVRVVDAERCCIDINGDESKLFDPIGWLSLLKKNEKIMSPLEFFFLSTKK